MHDRAEKPTGAVSSAAAIATEVMILLNIDVCITQLRLPVEEQQADIIIMLHYAVGSLQSLDI